MKYLLMSESRAEMQVMNSELLVEANTVHMQDKFTKEFEGIWPRDFVNYFKVLTLTSIARGT